MATLVFPSSIEESKAYAQNERNTSSQVIVGASSIAHDPSAVLFDHWENLPFIHEESFVIALKDLIQRHKITSIYTPHAPSYLRFTELSAELSNIQLMGESPYSFQIQRIRNALSDGVEALKEIAVFTKVPDHRLTQGFMASLLQESSQIYGECAREKIMALCALFCEAPQGDIIEIGSAFGKSAFILNRLAALFQMGTTVCIDPWEEKYAIQYESPSTIQKISTLWDWDIMFKGFLMNLQASHGGNLAYIRLPSEEAWSFYKDAKQIDTPEFGTVSLSGKISVLHIDGNHDELEVEKDFQNWSQRILPGGWIIFDDYQWSQGKGPYLVAERVLDLWKDKIERHFSAGGALFIHLLK